MEYVDQIQANSPAKNKRQFIVTASTLTEQTLADKLKAINSKRSVKSALLFYLFLEKHLEIYLIDQTGLVAAQGIDITAEQLLGYETRYWELIISFIKIPALQRVVLVFKVKRKHKTQIPNRI